MDNYILISHELAHLIGKQRTASRQVLAALKHDMNKAFDRVNWFFILKVLVGYGFPKHWIHMIHQCIYTITYSILIMARLLNTINPIAVCAKEICSRHIFFPSTWIFSLE